MIWTVSSQEIIYTCVYICVYIYVCVYFHHFSAVLFRPEYEFFGLVYFESAYPDLGEGNGNTHHIFAWRVPWTEEPGGLQSVGSQTVTRTFIDNVLHLCGMFQLIQCFTSTISLNPENNFVRQVFLFLEYRLKITGLLSNWARTWIQIFWLQASTIVFHISSTFFWMFSGEKKFQKL